MRKVRRKEGKDNNKIQIEVKRRLKAVQKKEIINLKLNQRIKKIKKATKLDK